MLRGPNSNNWPNLSLDSFSSSWCNNCHYKSAAGDPHTKSDHAEDGMRCYSCHIVIPHGGKMSRLIGDRSGSMPAPVRIQQQQEHQLDLQLHEAVAEQLRQGGLPRQLR